MKYVVAFGRFWYDFIVGDAWEIALGVILALAVLARLAASLWAESRRHRPHGPH